MEPQGGKSSLFHVEGQPSHLEGSDVCDESKRVRSWPGRQQAEEVRPGGQEGHLWKWGRSAGQGCLRLPSFPVQTLHAG